jgi:hypothetical protein
MKQILFLLAILAVVFQVQAQDTTVTMNKVYYSDSLKTTHDTIDVVVQTIPGFVPGISKVLISAYTTTSSDTAIVYTMSGDKNFWI